MHRVEEKGDENDIIPIQRIVQDIVHQYFLQDLVTAREIAEVLLAEMVAAVAAAVEIDIEMRLKRCIFLLL